MVESETFELPEDPWDELLHQGDVFEESVHATPAIVAALERGTDDDTTWLHVLAAMCVGRPERRAERIRTEAKRGCKGIGYTALARSARLARGLMRPIP
jgi:hypothetical protein